MQAFSSSREKGVCTYTAAISGLVEKGFHYFHSILDVHGIRQELDHYACMVDLLGCAGLLDEAEKFIASMQIEPDDIVWGALFNACRVHGNAEMSQRVGNLRIESDQNHDGRYVALSSIFAESMKGEEAEEVRKAMRRRKVKRVQGCSLIEVNGVVHEFFAGDRYHEKADPIYMA
ncbi:pentatricopeptide repeat-containing protein At5g48910-like [Cornus florida]|uniref:pentatricopeptide repeat-containing protein At5g48910-like n=1 Tax=Cornus florida TaxID=4283 RepID=UPI0028A288CC|nr:pentatricopeptide repeat-containing protein At5g48910-like [Cornus florida]